MTRPRINDLFEFMRTRAGRPVSFFEIKSAWPQVPPGEVRAQCSKLVKQGYIERPEFDTYQWRELRERPMQ